MVYKRIFLTLIVVSAVFVQLGFASNGIIGKFLNKADVIVEGFIVEKKQGSDHIVPAYVGQTNDPVLFNFGVTDTAFLSVTKVYKGKIKEGARIRIDSFPEITNDVTDLVQNGEYILFLKKRKIEQSYIICDFGQAAFRLFDYDGVKKIRSWFDIPALNHDSYQNYEDFIKDLTASLLSKFTWLEINELFGVSNSEIRVFAF